MRSDRLPCRLVVSRAEEGSVSVRIHEFKTWPMPFWALSRGVKTYEIRKDDRDFRVGDLLRLREWSQISEDYTGCEIVARISYKTPGGEWGLPMDVCVLGIHIEANVGAMDMLLREMRGPKGAYQ